MNKAFRTLSALLAVLLLAALLPVSAYAEIELVEPDPITWYEVGPDGEGHVYILPGEWHGEAKCDGIPGELVEIPTPGGPVTMFVRNTIDDQYLAANETWANVIRYAPENSTVKLNAETWYSINMFVANALEGRPDVSVEFDYLDFDTQQRMSLTIPAGTDLKGLMDGKEVIQFQDLAAKLAAAAATATDATATDTNTEATATNTAN